METLAYKMPDTGPPRVQRVLDRLMVDEVTHWMALILKVAIGLPMCLIGPLSVAAMLSIGWHSRASFNFLMILGVVSLLMVPLLFWFEQRRRRDFLWEAIQGETPTSWSGEEGGSRLMAPWPAAWWFYVEMILIGPRMILSTFDQLVNRERADLAVRSLASWIVVRLLDSDGTLAIATLMLNPDSTREQIGESLLYLHRREWIGISRRRDRVWLNTWIRKRLADL